MKISNSKHCVCSFRVHIRVITVSGWQAVLNVNNHIACVGVPPCGIV